MNKIAIFLLALTLGFGVTNLHAFGWGKAKERGAEAAKEMRNAMDMAKEKAKMLDKMLKDKSPAAHESVHNMIEGIKDDVVPMLHEAGFDAEKWIRSGSEGKAMIAALYYEDYPKELTDKAEKAMDKWMKKGSDILKEHIQEVIE